MCTKVTQILKNHIDMNHSNINFLIEQYGELKRYCTFLTKNKWDGEDLAQETVCKVLQKYSNKDICMTLVYKIARNRWLDQIKSKSVYEKIKEQITFEDPQENIADLHEMVGKVLSSLNVQQSTIFLLKDVFQYSIADIAKVCSVSEGAVKASLFRSRNRLKTVSEEGIEIVEFTDDIEVVVTSIREEKPELLTKLLPIIDFTKLPSKQPVLQFNAKKPSSYSCMLYAA
ncbi:RNA polymerase subunit sigma-70 [Bacillus wiedmannii]|uniref:RNA polymerase sigma-70 factor, ECF subfamily n=2 Tax=Bacillus cereus group TaxID=86661 RepID=A0A1D3P1T7_9BACI|nr:MULTISPECIES: RNA polymerase subunit sigma-70 [Bacillus]EJQ51778.1 sigma-70 family RNA polymerase sigma factor [Bacillus wiedmannii]KAA0773746.1 RNA polymerase subunit sigma-70 [Bacillus sp. BB51/4]KMP29731.1 RNA polymerase factor sigma-70 [Bacillus wiedmannii]MDI6676207.1 RNA polymerase subunit sigma-70 [Bacillus wiedmannii]MED2836504.1 RNA polymerase subunit sigma-70 [Bacillus wiedmannii]